MDVVVPGQRYVSEREPELGLGRIASVDRTNQRIAVDFPATKEQRLYALGTPVLKRVRFGVGETITLADGARVAIETVEDIDGLLHYLGDGRRVREDSISDITNVSSPAERFAAAQTDENEVFDLRVRALQTRARLREASTRGFLGGRVELIPHQFYILHEVASRQVPRVLLADEVGLGKTIEACLILQRLRATGEVNRVLIVVPEPLIHQWFVELLRRFNLWFSIYDEERCQSLERSDPDLNPFLAAQLALTSVSLLIGNTVRRDQVVAAGWDLLIVDEAHHLTWRPEATGGAAVSSPQPGDELQDMRGEDTAASSAGIGRRPNGPSEAVAAGETVATVRQEVTPRTANSGASPEYALVDDLARRTPAVLLLTATPTQLGDAGHFARLRLLDPDRYSDYDAFREQQKQLGRVAVLANRLVEGAALTEADRAELAELFRRQREGLNAHLDALTRDAPGARAALLRTLLDQHGIGRVMFRNTRAAIAGFPIRQYCPAPIPNTNATLAARVARELRAEEIGDAEQIRYNFRDDPRIDWLAAFLRGTTEGGSVPSPRGKTRGEGTPPTSNLSEVRMGGAVARGRASRVSPSPGRGNPASAARPAKVLLICRSARKAMAIETALQERMKAKSALFHEVLPLVQRDRNAAWFAEPDGAQLLICSEIGSEGRNFQFAHHLVLFDLPLDPGLVEQRIGRLDRIGQTETIRIHAPYLQGAADECLAVWYEQGVAAFTRPLHGGGEYEQTFKSRLLDLAERYDGGPAARADLATLVTETAAFRADLDRRMHEGRDRLLELNSFHPPTAAKVIADVRAAEDDPQLRNFFYAMLDHFGVRIREMEGAEVFLDASHAYVEAFPSIPADGLLATFDRARALAREDITFLSSDHPLIDDTIALLLDSPKGTTAFGSLPGRQPNLLLEAIFVLEPVAVQRWHLDRFLAPTPIRCVIDAQGGDITAERDMAAFAGNIDDEDLHRFIEQSGSATDVVKVMLAKAQARAEAEAARCRDSAAGKCEEVLNAELQRLVDLSRVNDHVRPQEITLARERIAMTRRAIEGARLRLDCLRLIVEGR